MLVLCCLLAVSMHVDALQVLFLLDQILLPGALAGARSRSRARARAVEVPLVAGVVDQVLQ